MMGCVGLPVLLSLFLAHLLAVHAETNKGDAGAGMDSRETTSPGVIRSSDDPDDIVVATGRRGQYRDAKRTVQRSANLRKSYGFCTGMQAQLLRLIQALDNNRYPMRQWNGFGLSSSF